LNAGWPWTSFEALIRPQEDSMAWSTPEIVEVCVGMEVTSYVSAEL